MDLPIALQRGRKEAGGSDGRTDVLHQGSLSEFSPVIVTITHTTSEAGCSETTTITTKDTDIAGI